jgi:inorganic pyrophosphatase
MSNIIQVFIENLAGSRTKNIHDEKTFEFKGSLTVARPYPFPYGFILDTTSEDGGNLDCFVLTNRALCRGVIVDCSVAGLMEQFEDGKQDHNILATLAGESATLTESVKLELAAFVNEVFSLVDLNDDVHRTGGEVLDYLKGVAQRLKIKKISAGKFLDVAPALSLIKQCSDKNIL